MPNAMTGVRLRGAVRDHAAGIGIAEMQWQTPAWTEDACRFHRRTGAVAVPTIWFTLPLGAIPTPAAAHDTGDDHGA